MMDFLRRLAPPSDTDATRAVAVMPSRFADQLPLRSTASQPEQLRNADDEGTWPSFDHASEGPRASARPARSSVGLPVDDGVRVRPQGPASTSTSALAFAQRLVPAVAIQSREVRTSGDSALHPTDDRRLADLTAAAAIRSTQARSGVFSEGPSRQGAALVPPTAGQRTGSLPLTQAALAQRTAAPRDDHQVVHVTIGRIDVVATTAPAPAPSRAPAPRQATVSLADYLRSGNGGRR
jgi:hypothetical protein